MDRQRSTFAGKDSNSSLGYTSCYRPTPVRGHGLSTFPMANARAQALTRSGADWAPVVPSCQKVPVDESDRDLGARRSGAYLSRATA
jgi:hypothetical protein